MDFKSTTVISQAHNSEENSTCTIPPKQRKPPEYAKQGNIVSTINAQLNKTITLRFQENYRAGLGYLASESIPIIPPRPIRKS